jgi:hypothetical protein
LSSWLLNQSGSRLPQSKGSITLETTFNFSSA